MNTRNYHVVDNIVGNKEHYVTRYGVTNGFYQGSTSNHVSKTMSNVR